MNYANIYIGTLKTDTIIADSLAILNENKGLNWDLSIVENEDWHNCDGFLGLPSVLEVECESSSEEFERGINKLFNSLTEKYKDVFVSWDFEEKYPHLSPEIDRIAVKMTPVDYVKHYSFISILLLVLSALILSSVYFIVQLFI